MSSWAIDLKFGTMLESNKEKILMFEICEISLHYGSHGQPKSVRGPIFCWNVKSRANIDTSSTYLVVFSMKCAYFKGCRRATLKSSKGRRLPMVALWDILKNLWRFLKSIFLNRPRISIWYPFGYIMRESWTFKSNQKIYGICLQEKSSVLPTFNVCLGSKCKNYIAKI